MRAMMWFGLEKRVTLIEAALTSIAAKVGDLSRDTTTATISINTHMAACTETNRSVEKTLDLLRKDLDRRHEQNQGWIRAMAGGIIVMLLATLGTLAMVMLKFLGTGAIGTGGRTCGSILGPPRRGRSTATQCARRGAKGRC